MSDGAAALWQAVFDALAADAPLQALIGTPPRLYDHVPDGTAFPYVVVGEGQTVEAGTDSTDGAVHRLTLHVWSRDRGRAQCRAVMDALHARLHEAALTLTGQALTYLRYDFAQVLRDRDGRTHHGVMRFSARTEPPV